MISNRIIFSPSVECYILWFIWSCCSSFICKHFKSSYNLIIIVCLNKQLIEQTALRTATINGLVSILYETCCFRHFLLLFKLYYWKIKIDSDLCDVSRIRFLTFILNTQDVNCVTRPMLLRIILTSIDVCNLTFEDLTETSEISTSLYVHFRVLRFFTYFCCPVSNSFHLFSWFSFR